MHSHFWFHVLAVLRPLMLIVCVSATMLVIIALLGWATAEKERVDKLWLVTDGGTVVIGGVIQTQNSINVSQVPLLGNIPVLGNLFKHTVVNTSNQELIFFITPRIIQT